MWKAAVLIACLPYSSAFAAGGEWTPAKSQITELEKGLKLPSGARPLNAYSRHYWGVTLKGTKAIRGALVYGWQIGIHAANTPVLQRATDQGCNWIYVNYDLLKKKTVASCDGMG